MSEVTAYLLQEAWVDGTVHDTVRVEVVDGRFTDVEIDADRPGLPIRGLTLPGFANTHSHAFHRALRGRAEPGGGSFWSWREAMYDVAARLDPDSYHAAARATYAEMVAAGFTSVGEFHYLHHQPDGTPYADATAMADALIVAARDVGLRITLLDTCYLSSGFGAPPAGVQRRFCDGDAERWAERVAAVRSRWDGVDGVIIGGAVHSVRAVPADQLDVVTSALAGRPLHVHVSEQPAENEHCLTHHGVTPTRLLGEHGVLGPHTTAVHATHLTDADVADLANTGTHASLCPTTEADLADGLGAAGRLREAGVPLSLGSDAHVVIDPFTEMRQLEWHERLRTGRRGAFRTSERMSLGTDHRSLGLADAGAIAVGQRADLVTIDTSGRRFDGVADPVAVATADDVVRVMIDGRPLVGFGPGGGPR